MKKLAKALTILLLMVLSYSAGSIYQYNKGVKHYQAACMLSDICHFAHDNIGNEFDEIYEDYVMNIDCDPKAEITANEIRSYSWCY